MDDLRLLFVAAALVILAGWLVALTVQVRAYTRLRARLLKDISIDQLEVLLAETLDRVDHLEQRGADFDAFRARAVHLLTHSLARPHVVRYNAYENIAGQQSMSLALLDRARSGLILTSLVGRDGGRLYVKPITDGVCATQLSDEESQALAEALSAVETD